MELEAVPENGEAATAAVTQRIKAPTLASSFQAHTKLAVSMDENSVYETVGMIPWIVTIAATAFLFSAPI